MTVPNQAPVADFSFAPTSPKKGETVNFSSLATDPEGRIQSLTWDLNGDNQFTDATGPTAAKAFATPGSHTVRLKILDQDGGSNTATKTITVASQPPVASFDIAPASPLTGEIVTFTSTSTDPDGLDHRRGLGHRQRRVVRRRHRRAGRAVLHDRLHPDGPPQGHGRRQQHRHDQQAVHGPGRARTCRPWQRSTRPRQP